jgi:hypothetical protein
VPCSAKKKVITAISYKETFLSMQTAEYNGKADYTCIIANYLSNLLDQVGNMVESIFHNNGLLSFNSFPFRLSLSPLQKAFLLCCSVLEKHLEQVCWQMSFKEGTKLNLFMRNFKLNKVSSGRYLRSNLNKFVANIPLRRQRSSDPELLRALLEQRVRHLLL